MENQQAASIPRRKKAFRLIAVIAAGFALCAVMKSFVCGKTGAKCLCLGQSKGESCKARVETS
jgi:hypothetical protein